MKIEKAKALRLEASINRDHEVRRAGRQVPMPWLAAGGVVVLAVGAWFFWPRPASVVVSNAATAVGAAVTSESTGGDDGTFTAAGYIEPIPPFPVKITPLVPGRIDEFALREGEAVNAGDVIARLNSGAHQKRAAELHAAATVNSHRVELAERELNRATTLASQGASTQRDLDQATAEVRVLRSETEKIRAEIASVEWQIEQSIIRSPVKGILYERTASEGHFINLDERHEIASVIDPMQLQVWVDVNQRDIARLREGAPALVSLDAEPGREFRARVDRILPRASLAKNTVRCILRLEEYSPALRPDMSVKVTFPEP